MKINNIFSMVYRSYVLKHMVRDVRAFLEDNLGDIEFKKDYWLHKAGLTSYKPVTATLGSVSLFVIGVAAGGFAALALAPKPGFQWRAEVKDKALDLVNRAQLLAADKIQTGAPARV